LCRENRWHIYGFGSKVFAQGFCLWVGANGRGHTLTKDALDKEIQRTDIGQLVAINFKFGSIW